MNTTSTTTLFGTEITLDDDNDLHTLLAAAIDDMHTAQDMLNRELQATARAAQKTRDDLEQGYRINELGPVPDQTRTVAYANQYELHAKYVRRIARVAGFDL